MTTEDTKITEALAAIGRSIEMIEYARRSGMRWTGFDTGHVYRDLLKARAALLSDHSEASA